MTGDDPAAFSRTSAYVSPVFAAGGSRLSNSPVNSSTDEETPESTGSMRRSASVYRAAGFPGFRERKGSAAEGSDREIRYRPAGEVFTCFLLVGRTQVQYNTAKQAARKEAAEWAGKN